MKPHTSERNKSASAFTLIESLTVLAVVAVLAALLLPALAASRPAAAAFQCLENQRRLVLAWRLYSNDYNETLVRTGGIADTATSTLAPKALLSNGNWVHGVMSSPGSPSSFDPALIRAGALFPYAKSVTLYKCPADNKTAFGVPTPRSVSMNGWLNPITAWSDPYARIYREQSDITNPAPASLWVIMDESPATINDGFFVCDPWYNASPPTTSTVWVDIPAAYHAGGCGISFADGHALIRKWSDPVVLSGSASGSTHAGQNPPTDLNWLQVRSTSH